jgi:hypothetical protein
MESSIEAIGETQTAIVGSPSPASAETVVSPSVPKRRERSYHGACKTCTSDKIGDVEKLLAMQTDATVVARRTGLSADSIRRHWRNHVSETRRAQLVGKGIFGRDDVDTQDKLAELRSRERDGLLLRLSVQRADLTALTKNADLRVAVRAHSVLLSLHQLIAAILGEVNSGAQVNIDNRSVHVGGSDVVELKGVLYRALATKYPEAFRAVMDELTSPKEITDGRS